MDVSVNVHEIVTAHFFCRCSVTVCDCIPKTVCRYW